MVSEEEIRSAIHSALTRAKMHAAHPEALEVVVLAFVWVLTGVHRVGQQFTLYVKNRFPEHVNPQLDIAGQLDNLPLVMEDDVDVMATLLGDFLQEAYPWVMSNQST